MKKITFGPWTINADVEATKSCYGQLNWDPIEACGCDPCVNFALVKECAYPPEAITLFEELGIDYGKPFELSHYSRMPSGLHQYGGWHYFCGAIESGPDFQVLTPHRVNARFEIAMTHPGIARDPFSKFRCVQVDFYTEVPWRAELPEPE